MPDNPPSDLGTADREAVGFDAQWYLATYPDIAAAGMDPWDHYIRFGQTEGRLPHALIGTGHERDLWDAPHADAGRRALEAQASGPAGPDRDMACWWLARWHASCGRWPQADDLCKRVIDPAAPLPAQPGIGLALLAAQAAGHVGDIARAHAVLDAAAGTWPTPGEVDLLRSTLDHTGLDALNHVWARAGLGRIRTTAADADMLDRLHPRRRLIGSMVSQARRLRAPVVSVVMPLFNAAATLPTALASLQTQSWATLDIIVVDDGSTDHSGDLARTIARKDRRIRVLALPENQGAYAARNFGATHARGDFITVMDADDWAHPEKIRTQIAPLIADPACKGSLSHWVRCDGDLVFGGWRMEADGLIHRNVSSLMIRRSVLDQLGYWDRVLVGADTEYYYRLIAAYGGAALTEVLPGVPLSLGRTGTGSLTGQLETHQSTDITGVRAAYQGAATRWHRRASEVTQTGDPHPLYLSATPGHRPFNAPAAVVLADDAPAPFTPDDAIRSCDMFDAQWYLDVNPDVRHAGKDAALHYLESGAAQGRDPSPRFSTTGYRMAHLEETSDANPLLHWLDHGLAPLPHFDSTAPDQPQGRHVDTLVFAHQAGQHLFGAERSLLDMLDQMRAQGRHALVVLPHIHNMDYLAQLRARSAGIRILPYRWRHRARTPHPDTARALDALIAEIAPRDVYINTLVLDAPAQAARRAQVPVTVHLRERPDQDAALCRAMGSDPGDLRDWLLEEADHFMATSVGVAEWIAAPDRTTLIVDQVDPALFDLPVPSFGPDHPVPRVALISSNIVKKGIHDFTQMARHLDAMGVDARCLLIGPPSADLTALGSLPARVETPGYTRDPLGAIGSADIVVSLSHFAESFGRTVLEAMAAGRPVVCYARGHLVDMVEDGVTGFLVTPDDPQAAADAVARLIRDPDMAARMGTKGRAYARALAVPQA